MKKLTKITVLCGLIGIKSVWAFTGTTPEMFEIVNDLDHPITINFDGSTGDAASMMRSSFILWQPSFDSYGRPIVDYSPGSFYEIGAAKIIVPAHSSTKKIGTSNTSTTIPYLTSLSGQRVMLSQYLQYSSRDTYITLTTETANMRYGAMKININNGNEFYVGYSGGVNDDNSSLNFIYYAGPVKPNIGYASYINTKDKQGFRLATYTKPQSQFDTSADKPTAPSYNKFYVSKDICAKGDGLDNENGVKENRSSGDYINCLLNLSN